ncbi:hypothetical protein NP493_864g00024 [Ridgeia piscesae]|uniref:Uncharacterized protein n=1 Tax=Ridgeia piscesae TaxID=27915 RepID=A0AAD9KNA7_RIDPI|nr:hypothetical protein NP493_864g00024 [Ridgeia piscesae]
MLPFGSRHTHSLYAGIVSHSSLNLHLPFSGAMVTSTQKISSCFAIINLSKMAMGGHLIPVCNVTRMVNLWRHLADNYQNNCWST